MFGCVEFLVVMFSSIFLEDFLAQILQVMKVRILFAKIFDYDDFFGPTVILRIQGMLRGAKNSSDLRNSQLKPNIP